MAEDTDDCPGSTEEVCLNCGHSWDDHSCWSCPGENATMCAKRSDLPIFERFFTHTMANERERNELRIVGSMNHRADDDVFATDPRKDPSNWQAWANNKPGECPCGILRSQCKYH